MSVLGLDRRGARSAFHGDTDEESDQEEHFQDICPSWMGQIFQVQYILRIYMEHDLFFSAAGEPSSVSLPIRIMAKPRIEPSSEPWHVPAEWNPYQGTEEPTYVYLQDPEEKPEYITRFIDRNWAKWEANVAPILEASEAISEGEQSRLMRRKKSAL